MRRTFAVPVILFILVILVCANSKSVKVAGTEDDLSRELYFAIWSNSYEKIKRVLDMGADPNIPYNAVITRRTDKGDINETWKYYPVMTIIRNDKSTSEEKIKLIKLFSIYKANFSISDNYDTSALEIILKDSNKMENKDKVAATLLEAGANPNIKDKSGYPLFHVVFYLTDASDKKVLLSKMISHGADLNQTDPYGNAILSLAITCIHYSKNTEQDIARIIELMIDKGANPNAVNNKGESPLFNAVRDNRLEAAEVLLRKGANINLQDKEGKTALMKRAIETYYDKENYARDEKKLMSTVTFLADKGANLNIRDTEGNTALYYAAKNLRAINLVKFFVSKGADINIGNEEGVTPMYIARQMLNKEIYEFLKQKGSKLSSIDYPADNNSPAFKAVLDKNAASLEKIPADDLSKIQGRTSWGVPATALHAAVEHGDKSIIEILCKRKVNWNSPDLFRRTPLHIAVLTGRKEIAALLIENGADPNFSCKKGDDTPFSYAACRNPELAELFLQKRVKPADSNPAAAAVFAGNIDLFKKLYLKELRHDIGEKFPPAFGQIAITEYMNEVNQRDKKEASQLLGEAKSNYQIYIDYDKKTEILIPKRSENSISSKKGNFNWLIEDWSPLVTEKVNRNLKDYPVSIYVPKDYNGSEPYGLMVFMYGRRASHSYPNPEYSKTMDKHRMIWVGFSSYNGIYEPFKEYHEYFCLSIVYQMHKYFNIDAGRIYLGGLSWGGRLTGSIVPRRPKIFSGGIAMGGCFTVLAVPGLYYARENCRLVLTAGDYDYNRREAFAAYSVYLTMNYKNIYYMQDPLKGHELLSGPLFERAVGLIEGKDK